MSVMNVAIRWATARRGIPERRSAHAVSATPARAGGREQPGRGEAGHRDLVADAEADALRLAADEHPTEQQDVAEEGADLERRPQRQPPPVPVLDPAPGVPQPEELRHHEVQEGQA
jgi:hypothetical protein